MCGTPNYIAPYAVRQLPRLTCPQRGRDAQPTRTRRGRLVARLPAVHAGGRLAAVPDSWYGGLDELGVLRLCAGGSFQLIY